MPNPSSGGDSASSQSLLAVTCGDPAGVGPEVIANALERFAERTQVCLLGPRRWTEPLATQLGCSFEAVGAANFTAQAGQPNQAGAALAMEAMEVAATGCVQGRFNGVVTGPVSKHALQQVGFTYPGQTEFFAARWGGQPTMGFVGQRMRVVLATWHIPLSAVPAALDPACLTLAVERAAGLARALGAAVPRIGVCGLNPHAGELGVLGREEMDLLDPVLDRLRAELPGLSRCLPGDTVFLRHAKGDFDVVVALYHDQGLAPLKLVDFDDAVNVTLGLPYVRTSPDHGTGFDIAGRGLASAGSLLAALRLARTFTAELA